MHMHKHMHLNQQYIQQQQQQDVMFDCYSHNQKTMNPPEMTPSYSFALNHDYAQHFTSSPQT